MKCNRCETHEYREGMVRVTNGYVCKKCFQPEKDLCVHCGKSKVTKKFSGLCLPCHKAALKNK